MYFKLINVKKNFYLLAVALLLSIFVSAQTITGNKAERMIHGAETIIKSDVSNIPSLIRFRSGSEFELSNLDKWLHTTFSFQYKVGLKSLTTEKDKLGMIHYRYQQTINGLPVEGTMYIVHTKNNKVISMNGLFLDKINNVSNTSSISETAALKLALNYFKAESYRWQSPEYEKQLKKATGNINATWYPKGELVYAAVKGIVKPDNFRLAYKFDIFADKPLKRSYIFVDANTGEIILEQNRIIDANTPATAYTVYSGHKPIMTDSYSGGYRLEESSRGLGIQTYNLQDGSNYVNTDFTNATTIWNDIDAALDQYATDAHWGAEKTYDFYDSLFQRNSIDNAGFALLSYVHANLVGMGMGNNTNAFWDGSEMTYGDGDSPYTPLTSVEITGHEISHGLTTFTSALGGTGSGEPGALNEGFSDCMGIAIRYFAKKSSTIDWLIGDQVGPYIFRDIANPHNTSNPTTYQGQYWDSYNQEVHKNSTILSHCFYLVTIGGSGTNDNGNTYNVTAIGIAKAEQIWFRMNTVYLSTYSSYADARTYSIQSAADLYGSCSPEVITVTNAWYAVGVGAAYTASLPVSNFTAAKTIFCTLPASVNFTNTSTNGENYTWYFGDNSSNTLTNPTHVYVNPGSYSVSLVSTSSCGKDSVTKTSFIVISPPSSPQATSPVNINCGTSASLSATSSSTLSWFTQASGGSLIASGTTYVTPQLFGNTTFYVENDVASAPVYDTPADNTFGGGNNYNIANSPYYNTFDVYKPCVLMTVDVYATGAGNRTVTLWNSSGTVLNSVTINMPDGKSTITLNFPLNIGTRYGLGVTGTANLYRNSSGAAFPYNDPGGYISITGNNIPDAVHYYFYYNWKLGGDTCKSIRTPILVNVSSAVNVSVGITANPQGTICAGTSVTFTADATNGGTTPSYQWKLNGLNTGTNSSTFTTSTLSNADSVSCVLTSSINCTSGNPASSNLIKISVYPNSYIYTIDGKVTYDNSANTPLNNVNIVLKNQSDVTIGTTSTDKTGYYKFSNLANGAYSITASSNNTVGSINPVDALFVDKNFIQLYKFSDNLKSKAADVNNDMVINPVDALDINKFYISLLKSFPAGKWLFDSPSLTIACNNNTQNIKGICVGDVNASFTPSGKKICDINLDYNNEVYVNPGKTFNLPVYVTRDVELGAMGLKLKFDNSEFRIISLTSKMDGLVYNILNDGINIAWSAQNESVKFNAGDAIFNLLLIANNQTNKQSCNVYLDPESIFTDNDAHTLTGNLLSMPKIEFEDCQTNDCSFNHYCYPNPFAQQTTLTYELNEDSFVSVKVFDMIGKEIITLYSNQQVKGKHELSFEAKGLVQGIYFYKIKTSGNEGVGKLIVMK